MKTSAFILFWLLCGCRPDMYNQARFKPLAENDFFPDHAAARPPVPNTVPRGHLNEDDVFYTGMKDGRLVDVPPVTVTRELLQRGRERFEIHCAVCHGMTGDGDGMIVRRGFPQPPSYHIDRLRSAPIGHFYNVISHGYGTMYSYAARVEPQDRWAIAAYLRALQLSHHAAPEDVPTGERTRLEAAR